MFCRRPGPFVAGVRRRMPCGESVCQPLDQPMRCKRRCVHPVLATCAGILRPMTPGAFDETLAADLVPICGLYWLQQWRRTGIQPVLGPIPAPPQLQYFGRATDISARRHPGRGRPSTLLRPGRSGHNISARLGGSRSSPSFRPEPYGKLRPASSRETPRRQPAVAGPPT